MMKLTIVLLAITVSIHGAPSGVAVSKSLAISGGGSVETDGVAANPLVSFDNGNVGVNFLGFRASAGLGGLLNGDAAGGLHAEAGTPYGQAAGAGLGGVVSGNGGSAGGLYAGATAGGGVAAGAGLAGDVSSRGSFSNSYSGASVGGVKETHITKISQPAVFHKHIEISSAPVVNKEVEIVEQVQPQKTYVERTVIPNYVEKTIQVPSYVEKTIRVPTVVEKTVRVPAAPTVIEKTVAAPASANFDVRTYGGDVGKVTVIEKTKYHHHPHHHKYHHHFVSRGGFGGGYGGGFGGGYGAVGAEDYGGNYGGSNAAYSASFSKSANPQFFHDIFNIPISTLGAVSKLVGGIAGGTSGSLSVSKSFSASG